MQTIQALVAAVRAQGRADAAAPLEPRLAQAPPVVARYLRMALAGSPRAPAALELRQAGRLRAGVASRRWLPFEAVHTVAPLGCAFAWNARVRIAPLLHVRVLDSLVQGRGAGAVLLQSLVRVSQDAGSEEMNSGSLHRFLAEAPWYPWALLPSEHLRWEALDGTRARATLGCHGCAVSLEFRFTASGEVAGIYSEGRWGRFDGGYRQVAWEGRFGDYERHDGLLVPRRGEVGWYQGGALALVWEAAVESVRCLAAS